MSLGVVVVESAQYSGVIVITALPGMELGRAAFAVPLKVTQPNSFRPNPFRKQGAKLVAGWEDVVEELPTPVGLERLPVEQKSQQERMELVASEFSSSERILYGLPGDWRSQTDRRSG